MQILVLVFAQDLVQIPNWFCTKMVQKLVQLLSSAPVQLWILHFGKSGAIFGGRRGCKKIDQIRDKNRLKIHERSDSKRAPKFAPKIDRSLFSISPFFRSEDVLGLEVKNVVGFWLANLLSIFRRKNRLELQEKEVVT